jgi:hypothetical protein
MPGFNNVATANNVRNGNRVALMIGDTIIYFAQTMGHQFPFGTEQLYGIGSAKPQEVQQLRISPQITVDTFSLTEQGQQTFQGGVSLPYILAGNEFDIHVYDGPTNTVIFTYVGCKAQNFSESVPANAPVRDAYSFLAMDVLDNDGNSVLDTGENALSVATSVLTGAVTIGLSPGGVSG